MIARRLFGTMPVNLAQILVGFGGLAVFSRLLSPQDYGAFTLVLSAMMLGHCLAFSWVEAAAFRFVSLAKAEAREADHFATLLALAGTAASLCGAASGLVIAGLVAAGILHGATLMAACLAALATGARFLTRLARETDRAEQAVLRYGVLESATLLLGFGFGAAAAALSPLGAAGPFLGLFLGAIAIAAADGVRLVSRARGGRARGDLARAYLAYGAPLAAALALDLFVQAAARFTVAAVLGEAAAGAYAAAHAISARIMDLAFVWIGAAVAPLALAAFDGEGREAVLKLARTASTTLWAIAAPAAVGLMLVARPLGEVLIGAAVREEAIPLAPWLAAAGLASGFMTHYYSEAFQLTRRTGLRAALMLAPAAATVALTAVLTPAFGLVGPAAAAAASALFGMALLALAGRRLLPLPTPWGALARIAIATGVMAAAVRFVPAIGGAAELALKAAVGALIYAVCVVALDVLGLREVARRRVAPIGRALVSRFATRRQRLEHP